MTRRTVLHLIHTGGAGGAETVVLQLVEHLDPEAWRSVAGVPGEGWLLSQLERTGAEAVIVPNSGPFDVRMLGRLVSVVRSHGVDLIHTHLFGPALYGGVTGRILRVPVVSTIHGAVDLAVAHKWFGMKNRLMRGGRSRFVAVTEALRRELVERLGIPPARIRVITNGVDVDRFAPKPARALREELGWTNGELVVGAVGNVRRPKGYSILLRAAALLRERAPRCRFVVVGDTAGEPELYEHLVAERRDLGLEDRVVFAGFRDDAAAALNNLDVYVMSSTREGLPLAVLQAMAVGLPIVATKCGGPQEILTHERDALLVAAADPEALADGLQRMADDAALRARLGAGALETVRARFALERTATAYEALYRECLGDPNVRRELDGGGPAR